MINPGFVLHVFSPLLDNLCGAKRLGKGTVASVLKIRQSFFRGRLRFHRNKPAVRSMTLASRDSVSPFLRF